MNRILSLKNCESRSSLLIFGMDRALILYVARVVVRRALI